MKLFSVSSFLLFELQGLASFPIFDYVKPSGEDTGNPQSADQ